MRIDVFSLFPNMFAGPLDESIVHRAVDRGLASIKIHDIRDFGIGRHRSVDDTPYGGGAGMVMAAPPIFDAVEAAIGSEASDVPIILMSPSGQTFTQHIAVELSRLERIALICGRYEGVDQRVRDHLVTLEISIGDYVLTGGELAAMVVIDAVVRLLPGVIDPASLEEESHSSGLLEYPHYTRPVEYRNWRVPDILLSGHHAEIAKWRHREAEAVTRARRPDMLPGSAGTDAQVSRSAPDSPVVD